MYSSYHMKLMNNKQRKAYMGGCGKMVQVQKQSHTIYMNFDYKNKIKLQTK
jgi:hypothetical protein